MISPNFRRVSIEIGQQEELKIIVILEHYDEQDLDEIEDLCAEFEALYETSIDVETDVNITDELLPPLDPAAHTVFMRREF